MSIIGRGNPPRLLDLAGVYCILSMKGENKMTNENDNRIEPIEPIELIGLNEFIQDDEDERPFPDSDEAIRALQDDAEDAEIEIARLRAELKAALAERDEAKGTITRMRDGYEGCCPLCETVGILNVKLLAERDAARREICELRMPCVGSQRGYAKGRGWDCYKEESK